MLKFFQKSEERPKDIKEIRHQLTIFIKDQLKKAEGGEGGTIRSMCLYLAPAEEERHLYESAVFFPESDRFKNEEVQRIADDYAIELPEKWSFEIIFEDTLPGKGIKSPIMPAAFIISSGKQTVVNKTESAVVRVIQGGAEQAEYTITPAMGRINIGRDRQTRTSDGFSRENFIAFSSAEDNPAGRYVSRQHAHIGWDPAMGGFMLYADEGGIPPGNKVKLRQSDGKVVRLQTTEIGHALEDGDQIVLGESVLMEFHYLKATDKSGHE